MVISKLVNGHIYFLLVLSPYLPFTSVQAFLTYALLRARLRASALFLLASYAASLSSRSAALFSASRADWFPMVLPSGGRISGGRSSRSSSPATGVVKVAESVTGWWHQIPVCLLSQAVDGYAISAWKPPAPVPRQVDTSQCVHLLRRSFLASLWNSLRIAPVDPAWRWCPCRFARPRSCSHLSPIPLSWMAAWGE